jgi:hypothetical protein
MKLTCILYQEDGAVSRNMPHPARSVGTGVLAPPDECCGRYRLLIISRAGGGADLRFGARTFMTIMGLPFWSFVVLIVVPAIIVAYQFYYCWQVYSGRRE